MVCCSINDEAQQGANYLTSFYKLAWCIHCFAHRVIFVRGKWKVLFVPCTPTARMSAVCICGWQFQHIQYGNSATKKNPEKEEPIFPDLPLNCSLTKNSNGLSILLNHNQLVLKSLESVQCEMYFCVIFIQPSPLDLGFKPPHFSSGSLQWLTFRPGNQERLSSFNHTHEDFF